MQPLSMNQSKTNKNRRNAALIWRVWAFLFALILLVTAVNVPGIARADEEPVATGESEEPGAAGAAEEPGKDQPMNGNGEDEPVNPSKKYVQYMMVVLNDGYSENTDVIRLESGQSIKMTVKIIPADADEKRVFWDTAFGEGLINIYSDEECTQPINQKEYFMSNTPIYFKAPTKYNYFDICFKSAGTAEDGSTSSTTCYFSITSSPTVGSGESEEPEAPGAAEDSGIERPVNGEENDEPVGAQKVDTIWSADSAGNPFRKWSVGYGGTVELRIVVAPGGAYNKRIRWKADTEETRVGLYLDRGCTQRIYPGDSFLGDTQIYVKALVDREEHCVIKFESVGERADGNKATTSCEIDIVASPTVGSGESPQTGDFNWQLLSLMMLIAAVTVATVVMVRNKKNAGM